MFDIKTLSEIKRKVEKIEILLSKADALNAPCSRQMIEMLRDLPNLAGGMTHTRTHNVGGIKNNLSREMDNVVDVFGFIADEISEDAYKEIQHALYDINLQVMSVPEQPLEMQPT